MTATEVLRTICDRHGVDVLSDGKQLLGLFEDYSCGKLRPQANALRVLVECGGNERIAQLRTAPALQQKTGLHRLVQELVTEYSMQETMARGVCGAVWEAFCGSACPLSPAETTGQPLHREAPPQEKQPEPKPKPLEPSPQPQPMQNPEPMQKPQPPKNPQQDELFSWPESYVTEEEASPMPEETLPKPEPPVKRQKTIGRLKEEYAQKDKKTRKLIRCGVLSIIGDIIAVIWMLSPSGERFGTWWMVLSLPVFSAGTMYTMYTVWTGRRRKVKSRLLRFLFNFGYYMLGNALRMGHIMLFVFIMLETANIALRVICGICAYSCVVLCFYEIDHMATDWSMNSTGKK